MNQILILISANLEWRAIRSLFPAADYQVSPYGEWFQTQIDNDAQQVWPATFFHGGWGKISAAGSTQYVIDRWQPDLLVNLGTCGGFEGSLEQGSILLVERTLIYDIIEQMGDFDEHIAHYTTSLDLSWAGAALPPGVRRSLLVSADRDLLVEDIPQLQARYGAVAGDWESGAIAWVAARNGTRCLILRAVSDLVGSSGDETYGNLNAFETAAAPLMAHLVELLPYWLAKL